MPEELKDIAEMERELDAKKEELRGLCESALKDKKVRTGDFEARASVIEAAKQDLEIRIKAAKSLNAMTMEEGGAGQETPEERSGFSSLGEMLSAVRRSAEFGQHDNRLVRSSAEGMNETVPSEGGYLVGQDLLGGVAKRMYDRSLIAGRCERIPIGANSNSLKWNEIDEVSRKDGSRNGGVRAYWTGEAGTVAASFPKLATQTISLQKVMAFVYATEELLQDTTALEAMVTNLVGDEIAYKLDDTILNGDGSGKPLGWANSNAAITVSKESGQAAGSIVFENIVKMRSRLWARSRGNSVWYINQDCEPELHTMSLAVGTGGVPVYLPASGLAGAPYDTLYGRPVIPIEHAETVGTAGDIWYCDPSQYRLIDKGGIKQAVSMHVKFLTDEQVFRFTYRVNGQPLWSSALTPAKGVNTQSPFVRLQTRA